MTYNQIIKDIIKAKGNRSYDSVAKEAGVSKAQTYKVIQGKSIASGEVLIKLAKSVGLEITINYISK